MNDPLFAKRPLYRALKKHGIENFDFIPIYCSLDGEHTLKSMETHFIVEYGSFIEHEKGYNLTMGGESNFGWIPSNETRKLWSKQRSGRQLTESHRQAISEGGKRRYAEHPEHRDLIHKLCIEHNIRPPRPTREQIKKGAMTRTGGHIHSDERKAQLSKLAQEGKLGFNTEEAWSRKLQTWKEMERGKGEKNGRSVFCNIYNPSGELVLSGHLQTVCDEKDYPFNKFLAASRHGNRLQRSKWKGWLIQRISKDETLI